MRLKAGRTKSLEIDGPLCWSVQFHAAAQRTTAVRRMGNCGPISALMIRAIFCIKNPGWMARR